MLGVGAGAGMSWLANLTLGSRKDPRCSRSIREWNRWQTDRGARGIHPAGPTLGSTSIRVCWRASLRRRRIPRSGLKRARRLRRLGPGQAVVRGRIQSFRLRSSKGPAGTDAKRVICSATPPAAQRGQRRGSEPRPDPLGVLRSFLRFLNHGSAGLHHVPAVRGRMPRLHRAAAALMGSVR
jgi:hypothetical protein